MNTAELPVRLISSRIAHVNEKLSKFSQDPSHNLELGLVSKREVDRLRSLDYFPVDMLAILVGLGHMKSWRFKTLDMINWWPPCSNEAATANDDFADMYSNSELSAPDFLYFAWDRNGSAYYYDTTKVPWEIISSAGILWPDALSILEGWVEYMIDN